MKKNKKNLTELVFILDRSGSMGGLESDTIGGFNSMISKNKQSEGDAIVTVVLFNHDIKTLYDRIPIKDIPEMTEKDYQTSGTTALIDAIGTTIDRIEKIHKESKKEEVPSKTMFVITTDGQENSSKEYSSTDVRKKISRLKEGDKWEFMFIGANIDAVETAGHFGIDADHAANYKSDKAGTAVLYDAMAEAVMCCMAEPPDLAKSQECSKPRKSSWKKKLEEDLKKRS